MTRVLFEQATAVGVEYLKAGVSHRVYASREVILAGGAVNSPQLLMLSGVGDGHALRSLGITNVVDLPGVGKNLQDHVEVSVKYECKAPITTPPYLQPHKKLWLGLEWLLRKKGLGATNHFEVAGYVKTHEDVATPNIQIVFIPLLVGRDAGSQGGRHGFQATVSALQPKSRGTIELRSRDPREAPKIVFNYLCEDDDIDALRAGITIIRRLFAAPAFDEYRGEEIEPGVELQSETQLDSFIRATVNSTHHPSSTCKMGMDRWSVVDAVGNVHGVERLRVVDASIMPSITSGNINAPTTMMAERIADLIG